MEERYESKMKKILKIHENGLNHLFPRLCSYMCRYIINDLITLNFINSLFCERHEKETSRNLPNYYVSYFSYRLHYVEDLSICHNSRTDGSINYFKRFIRCKGTCKISRQNYEL